MQHRCQCSLLWIDHYSTFIKSLKIAGELPTSSSAPIMKVWEATSCLFLVKSKSLRTWKAWPLTIIIIINPWRASIQAKKISTLTWQSCRIFALKTWMLRQQRSNRPVTQQPQQPQLVQRPCQPQFNNFLPLEWLVFLCQCKYTKTKVTVIIIQENVSIIF